MDFLDDETPKKSKAPLLAGTVIAVLILLLTGYFFVRYRQSQKLLSNPTEAAKKDQAETVKKVKMLVEVPENEEPTVATVSDIDKLRDKSFFTSAQNGDKVLVYAAAKKAILYRPSSNKVVEMTVINLQVTPTPVAEVAGAAIIPTAEPTQAPKKPLTVTILNGTRIAGLAAKAEAFVTGKSTEYIISSTGNAQNRSQEETIVVDLSGKNSASAQILAQLLNASIKSLPDGEITPSTDLVIILGTDADLD